MRSRYILGIVAFLLAGAGIYALASWRAPQPTNQQGSVFAPAGAPLESSTNTVSTMLGAHRQPPVGYAEYYSSRYRFSLFYPNELHVSERDEGGGASTITFQNTDTVHGFQIFVVPYGASRVTEEQFKKDEPSGVREGLQNIAIDGATGATFFSTNPALGDTAEIWFVRGLPGQGGYLYEVTTLKPLASWLGQIMATWKFI